MGEIEGWSQIGVGGGSGGSRLLPNGLLPNAVPLIENLDSERWLKAEERTAELINCIQPNQPSEERRNAVADYVQRLIMKCFPCQVFTFGSVPLKTYLPDGDIDLTAFSNNPNLKDSWAREVCDLLETEEKNENAEFHVKEVQYIQAEVKIIKCLVENIVVDISFNQLGGLCTLCFLEEVDNLINQNHLFKRSIILIKAWCYYESRILGAHHGLISTYALETLVLYIFHVFNNSFAGPLEVLYRFLEFFSNFDWDNYCVSLWGPVPVNSLPDVTAEPPRKDSGELLLNKVFLDACSSVYAVLPAGQESQPQTFLSKHFNVIDPLRVSNNLGRSVSKGNFFRIRSAFAYGADRLARLLDCPKENLVTEVNQFFTNTWDRHGNGIRPDAPVSESTGKKSEVGFDHTQSTNSPKTSVVNTVHANDSQRNIKLGQLVNDIQRSPFARTRSSPELTDTYKYVPFQGTRSNQPEPQKNRNRRKNMEPENVKNEIHEPASLHHVPPQQTFEPTIESNIYYREQEEQDLVNMMASSGFHGLNGPGHLPFPISPSYLASLGYTQRNMAGINFPFIDPQFSGMQFPHGLFPHYFPGIGMNSSSEELVDQFNENNLGNSEINFIDNDNSNDLWRENDRVNSEIVSQDNNSNNNKPQTSSTGMNYVPPPRRVGGSGGLLKSQQKSNKEKRERLRDNNKVNESYSDEQASSSRFSSAAHSNSIRNNTSSENSWDETLIVNKSTKEKRGKKPVNIPTESEDDDQDWGPVQIPGPPGSELVPNQLKQVAQVPRPHGPGTEPAQTSGSGSGIPMPPMIIGSNPSQRALTFYPTGPPVPFLTMLPFNYATSANGSPDPSASHFDNTDNSDIIGQTFHPGVVDQPNNFNLRVAIPGESPDEHKPDILNSDFASHWQNLQFGRFCQSPRQHGPTVYPPPVMVPPVYLQGRVPWDGPGRPLPNMNLVTQLMNYGPRLVPVAPVQPVPNRPPNVYQHYVEDIPRYRSGTGTYLPNPKVGVWDRTRRGNYTNDRSDSETNSNWNGNSKSRGSGRKRNQTDKSTARLGSNGSRSMNSRHDSLSGNANVTHGMYPLPGSGVPPNGSNGVAGMVMVYPYDQNVGFASQNEQVESPRLSIQLSSPDQPSSPHHQRRL